MNYLALCCIAKDEDPFFREWIAYHALLGVEHFYIYDNMSATPVRQMLRGWVDEERITIRRVPGEKMQVPVYQDCLNSFGDDNFWIGFLDLDEFALPMLDDDLRVLLSEYEPYAGLAATWHLMNSSGHLSRPQGMVIENYTQAFAEQESYHIKSFVRPEKTLAAHGPHTFIYKPGEFCVNEDHFPLPPRNPRTFAIGRKLRVNHYFVRSQEDFAQKLARGRSDGGTPHEWIMFYHTAVKPWVTDTQMRRFWPVVRRLLNMPALPGDLGRVECSADYEELMHEVMRLAGEGKTAKAQVLLCSAHSEYVGLAEYWLLRAMLAAAEGRGDRQEVFLRQAFLRNTLTPAYKQLAVLFKAQGRQAQVKAIEDIVRLYADEWERHPY